MKALFAVFSNIFLLSTCALFAQSKAADPSHFQGWAMTMPYHVIVAETMTDPQKKEISSIIAQTFWEIDQIFNKWNPQSELSRLNQTPAHTIYPLSRPLFQLLVFCDHFVQLSSSRFDPTIEPLNQLWAKAFHQSAFPKPQEEQQVIDSIGWHHISFQNGSFQKDNANTQLDLCSIAKGLCVDWIIERLQTKGYQNLFVEWSGKIRAIGRPQNQKSWQVTINPQLTMNHRPLAPIDLQNVAIATSCDCKQKNWHLKSADGKDHYYFQIIDPIQAAPLEKTEYSIASVTVIAPTCALANVLATTAMAFSTHKEAQSWAKEMIELYPQVSFWILAYDIKTN